MGELERQTTAADPLASLHKMSTTAGIVSADYVAISNLAIGAAVLGLATALSIVWLELALLAVAGVVLGILALRSIRNSDGTLTGRGIALAGIILSVVLAAAGGIAAYVREAALRPDKQAVNKCLTDLGNAIIKSDYDAAYQLFDPDWQKAVKNEVFEQGLLAFQHPQTLGKITSFEPNDRFMFYSAGGSSICNTRARVHFKNSRAEITISFALRQQADGRWKIVFFDEVFPKVTPLAELMRSPQNGKL
jgi:hypothetical protein